VGFAFLLDAEDAPITYALAVFARKRASTKVKQLLARCLVRRGWSIHQLPHRGQWCDWPGCWPSSFV
jgi:hypothetical protein